MNVKKIAVLLFTAIMILCLSGITSFAEEPTAAWSEVADVSWYNASETAFTISTAEQLAGVAAIVNGTAEVPGNFAGKTITLANDIDLAGKTWTPIGSAAPKTFNGTFDGDNHTIRNLKIEEASKDNVGFFGNTLEPTVIENLNFINADVIGNEGVAVIAGRKLGAMRNVSVTGLIKVEAAVSGEYSRAGVVSGGWCYGTYENCYVDGDAGSYVKGNGRYCAGIAGHPDDVRLYSDCHVKNIEIIGKWLCGGIAGAGPSDSVVKGCSVENVAIKAYHSGGFFGWYYDNSEAVDDKGVIENCLVKNLSFTGSQENNAIIGGYDQAGTVAVRNVYSVGNENTITQTVNAGITVVDDVTESKDAEGNTVYTPVATVAAAQIGDTSYATLAEAISDAKDGDTITVLSDINYEEATTLTFPDNYTVTLTSEDKVTINNAKVYQGANSKLTVDNLKFTGGSYIRSGGGDNELIITDVIADKTSAASSDNNTRTSFISLFNEQSSVKLTVTGCNITADSSILNNCFAIGGWSLIKDGSRIENNVFGSESNRYVFAVMKFLNFASNANLYINNNTMYTKTPIYACQFSPNCARDNYYVVYGANNTMDSTGSGANYLFDIDKCTSGTNAYGNINLENNNYVNGVAVTASGISISNKNAIADYVGVGVLLNGENKIIGGTFSFINQAAVAEGYEATQNGSIWTVAPAAPKPAVGEETFETIDEAIEAAKADAEQGKEAQVVTVPVAVTEDVAEQSFETTTIAAATETAGIEITSDYGTVTLNQTAVANINAKAQEEQKATIKVKVENKTTKTETIAEPEKKAVVEDVAAKDGVVYDITLTADDLDLGEHFDANSGTATVSLVVPEALADPKVYYVADDGTKTDMNAEISNGLATFTTTHFSTYVIESGCPIFFENLLAVVNMDTVTTGEYTCYPIEICAGIDSLAYSEVGFKIKAIDINGTASEVTQKTSTVYTAMNVTQSNGDIQKYIPADFDASYLFGNRLLFETNTYSNATATVYITPFATDLNGKKIWGNTTVLSDTIAQENGTNLFKEAE